MHGEILQIWHSFGHTISYLKLAEYITSKKRSLDGREMKDMVHIGLLSESETGNYSLIYDPLKNHVINPFIGDTQLYFVCKRDAEGLARAFKFRPTSTPWQSLTLDKYIRKHGDYVIPDNPTTLDLKIMFMKSGIEDPEKNIIGFLLKEGILSKEEIGNYAIASEPCKGQRYYLNFGNEAPYFTSKELALEFASSLYIIGSPQPFVVNDKKRKIIS